MTKPKVTGIMYYLAPGAKTLDERIMECGQEYFKKTGRLPDWCVVNIQRWLEMA
jgi:hypothetical protein